MLSLPTLVLHSITCLQHDGRVAVDTSPQLPFNLTSSLHTPKFFVE